MTDLNLNETLKKHAAWLNGDTVYGARANLWCAHLWGANLGGVNLWRAHLWGADLRGANLRYADLRGADLWGANLGGVNLWCANLWGANLRGANLRDADLRRAHLWGANLRDCTGNMQHVKSVMCDQYAVAYTADVMQIGCERHTIEDWWGFDDERIAAMDGHALEWWRRWKPILKQIIDTSPAEPTRFEE